MQFHRHAQNESSNHHYGLLTLVLLTLITLGGMFASAAQAEEVVVYKSPTCGCCTAWVKHLEENGFTVKVRDRIDMTPVKDSLGVPHPMRSCHTARVGGYLIEGHVPADLIKRVLEEKPAVDGVAVPGMPMGSPGMEGPWKDHYQIMTFNRDGSSSVYAER